MNTDAAGLQLSQLEAKVQQLVTAYAELQKKHAALEKEHSLLQQQLQQQQTTNQLLQEQVQVMKLGVQHWGPEQRKALQKTIDTYLKDIEKCLSLLNA